jgi:hypothetical protein
MVSGDAPISERVLKNVPLASLSHSDCPRTKSGAMTVNAATPGPGAYAPSG